MSSRKANFSDDERRGGRRSPVSKNSDNSWKTKSPPCDSSLSSPPSGGRRKLYSAFVGNLPVSVSKTQLHELFKGCGHVHEIFIADSGYDMSFTYGFVRFTELEACAKAVKEINQWPLQGRFLRVEFAKLTNVDKMADSPKKFDELRPSKPKLPNKQSQANFDRLKKAYNDVRANAEYPTIDIMDVIEALNNLDVSLVDPITCEPEPVTVDIARYSDLLKDSDVMKLFKPGESKENKIDPQTEASPESQSSFRVISPTPGNKPKQSHPVSPELHEKPTVKVTPEPRNSFRNTINATSNDCTKPFRPNGHVKSSEKLPASPSKSQEQVPEELNSVEYWNNLNRNKNNNSRSPRGKTTAEPQLQFTDIRYKRPEIDGLPDIRFCDLTALRSQMMKNAGSESSSESVRAYPVDGGSMDTGNKVSVTDILDKTSRCNETQNREDSFGATRGNDSAIDDSYIKKVLFGRGKRISTSPHSKPGGLQTAGQWSVTDDKTE